MKLKRKIGIRTQVFIGFAFFTAIIVVLLWLFQISLLNTFYRAIKEMEIKRTANTVIENLDSDTLSDTLVDIVKSTNIDIMITDQSGVNVINVSSMHSDLFQKLTIDNCYEIYVQTAANGGEHLTRYKKNTTNFGFQSTEDYSEQYNQEHKQDDDDDDDDKKNGDGDGSRKKKQQPESIVYVKIATTASGEQRMVILNTVVTPVDATVETLKVQLWCLTGVMLILSFILALVISRKISKPIISINESAKELAKGDYSINFEEKGSKEISELASTLNYAGNELSKVDGLRKELIANVSHDLRTPLTMITGYSEVMRDIPGENTPENVQIIIDESNRLTKLVNDMLDISKMESGKQELSLERYNLTASIEDMLSRYDKLADYKFNFYRGDDAFVYADELKISQVVYNLVNNAITYTGEDKSVTVKQTIADGKVKIEVTDTGDGIPQDKLMDIWDRYYKVDKSHKRASVGTGLGLSIVKKILDMHQGEYGVISCDGVGSTFWFSLNLAE